MKTFPSLSILATFLVAAFPGTQLQSAEDAQAIFEKFEKQKAEALVAYLESNPEDSEAAESMLVEVYMNLDQPENAAPLLQARYDRMPKGADAQLQELIPGVIQPLFQLYSKSGKKEEARALLEQAKKDLADHQQGSQVAQFFDGMLGELDKPSVGDVMEIAFTATDGSEINLADMKDKVVLVDFWATWCGPCVGEMPNLIKAYEEYHEKGFEILGISLDQDKAALEKFVEERKMTWPQFFDGKGWENELAGKFGIKGIPATFLIGKDGTVVATDLRGDALEQALEEHLGGS